MPAIKGTIQNGQIVPDEPLSWPEGCRVLIEPLPATETLGLPEEDWPTDPAGIARHLALMDQIEPLIRTPDEEAEWQAARKAQKDFEKANFEKWSRQFAGISSTVRVAPPP
jgi:hypothetical protein